MVERKRLGVALSLPLCLRHGLCPAGRAALGRPALHPRGGGLAEQIEICIAPPGGRAIAFRALLRL